MLGWARKSKGITKIILGLVVIATVGSLALAMYGLWGGGLAGKEQGSPDWIANVDGEPIPTKTFIKTRGVVENDLRQRFAGQASDDALSAFVDQQALGAVLGQYLTEREATRAGLRVTPAELKDDIISMPQWQRDGRFIGADQYRKILESARINIAEFEGEREKEIAAEKLRAAVFSLARIDDAEVARRYTAEVERVDVDYVVLADSAFADAKEPSAADTKNYYEAHRADYVTAEARRAAYVLFDREAKAASVQVSDAEIGEAYEKGKATTYTHPDQRRASHILFKLPQDATPAQDAEVKAKASAILARARGGEDFAALARQSSEDPGSAASGGDLGFFGRNRMVKEFEDAAFSLSVGAVSDLVKSPFGYHVIKVTEARAAGVDPLAEVKDEIRRGLAVAKSQAALRVDAQAFQSKLAAQEASFDKTAAAMGYKLGDTGFFAKGEPAGPLGRLPQVDDALFTLKPGGFSAPVTVPQGLAVLSLTDVRAPQPSPFETVRARAEADLKKSRSRAKARSTAAEILGASGTLAARVEKKKLEVKSLPQVNRSQPAPPITDAAKAAAFGAAVGSVLGPYDTDQGLMILALKGKTPATQEQAAADRAALKRRMLDEDRTSLYQALLARLEKTSTIDVNEGLLRKRTQG